MNYALKSLGFFIQGLITVFPPLGLRLAYKIFCYPFNYKLKPNQKAYLKQIRKADLVYDNQSIALYSKGSGGTHILCLHGWRSNAYRWKKFLESFDLNTYTVHALEAPAHGASSSVSCNIPLYAKAIEEFCKQKHKPDAVIAHSMGCLSALHLFAEQKMLSPKKLILLAPPGRAQDFVDFYVKALGLKESAIQRLEHFFLQKFGYSIEHFSLQNLAPQVNTPSLIVHDKQDKDVSVKYVEELQVQWSSPQYYFTDGYGHKLKHISVLKKVLNFIA